MSNLYSARWHRIAGLTPRLSPQLRLRRQQLRGETWFLLADPASGRSLRLNRQAWALVGRFDGERSMQALWDGQLAMAGEPMTQDEAIDLLSQLREAALLQLDRGADFDRLLPHLETVAKPKGRTSLLAIRVPLADPSALLDRLQGLSRLLFTRSAFALWLLAMVSLVVLAVQHAGALWAHAQLWLATPRFALLAALLYLPIKLLHELGHGLAVRRWGGQVHEAGVTFMLLMPVPYVNAAAATAFPRRRQRIAVSAAGIMVELTLAAIALPLWLVLDEGWPRDIAFVTLAITGISTLLFNGNPLQRLDGYYVFSDALALPNLAPRSRGWWLDQLSRRGLRLPGAEPMAVARGETPWLALYAPLSWCYSLLIAGIAVFWLGQWSLSLGLLCALLLGWQIGLRPAWRLFTQVRRSALAGAGTARRWQRALAFGALALVGLLVLPWPQRTLVQGVVWPADQAQLRADEDGFVATIHAHDGDRVEAGALVLQLANPALQTQFARQNARVAAIEAELFQAIPGGALPDARVGDRQAELAAAAAERDHLQQRIDALAVRVMAGGRLALPQSQDLQGGFVRRGSLLGQVLADEAPIVRVALPEAQASELQREPGSISVRLRTDTDSAHDASLLRDSGGAVLQLPSAALSQRHGGPVATDPRDAKDLQPMQPVVVLDVRLRAGATAHHGRIGERAWVRFDDGWSPLALQLARHAKHVVMQRFNPQF